MTFAQPDPPAGWYPDSTGVTRYWDGSDWTQHAVSQEAPAAVQPTSHSATPRPTRRRYVWLIVAIVVVLAVGGTAAGIVSQRSGTSAFAVSGSVTLTDSDVDDPAITAGPSGGCQGSGGYSDMQEGAQVIVADQDGTTLALGSLGAGVQSTVSICVFPVMVSHVPAGKKFYGIEVTHRGFVQYTEAQLKAGPGLTLGN